MNLAIGKWMLAFSAAVIALLVATANDKSGLSKRLEPVIAHYLPDNTQVIVIRYIALLVTGLFAAAYTLFVVHASENQAVFASALTSTMAVELFPGTSVGNRG